MAHKAGPLEAVNQFNQASQDVKQHLKRALRISSQDAEKVLPLWINFCEEARTRLEDQPKPTKTTKLTKTSFILSFLPNTPAKKVINEAAKVGLKVTSKMVYSVRSAHRTKQREIQKVAKVGRRQVVEGLRPSLRDAIVCVMGDKEANATEILERLKKRGWLPNSQDKRGAVLYMLSKSDTFRRVGRGVYKVQKPTPAAKEKPPVPKESLRHRISRALDKELTPEEISVELQEDQKVVELCLQKNRPDWFRVNDGSWVRGRYANRWLRSRPE